MVVNIVTCPIFGLRIIVQDVSRYLYLHNVHHQSEPEPLLYIVIENISLSKADSLTFHPQRTRP